ncbi:MAG: iron-containing alcohol dehydrogenase, partial [Bacteroidetes bacterium]|nr:iron-containing alcohol dehydrogenase [Bacteroidota bacterium]
FGKKVLLVYGKGSIKRNGIYDAVMEQLKLIQAEVDEYSGIKSNPVIEDVDAAAEVGRKFQPDVILAVGGGSVIDSAKIIALTIPVDFSGWKFMTNQAMARKAVPLVSVLTLAATGTEMNQFAVVQNHATKQKLGYGNRLIYPRHSFLDPQYTFSVPRNYTAYGISDLIAHAMEYYFGKGDASLSDRFVYSIIQEAMEIGPKLLKDLTNYDYRAKIMYAATCALNGLTAYGRVSGDWGVHDLGHVISLLYDTPHGATLSVVYPAWLKRMKERIPARIEEFGRNVFIAKSADETIISFERFMKNMDCPIRMNEIGIEPGKKQEIIETMMHCKVNGSNLKLEQEDMERIVDYMFLP